MIYRDVLETECSGVEYVEEEVIRIIERNE
jgi:hypothetical protein